MSSDDGQFKTADLNFKTGFIFVVRINLISSESIVSYLKLSGFMQIEMRLRYIAVILAGIIDVAPVIQ